MKNKIILTCIMLSFSNIAIAEIFFWQDKSGINMTDDASKLPKKFREYYNKSEKIKLTNSKESIPESAKNAVRALKKLEARCQAGISYRDFGPALGDAKFEVNMFIDSGASKNFENLKQSIVKAMEHYEYANIMWQYRFDLGEEVFKADSSYATGFLQRYPEANKPDSEGGLINSLNYIYIPQVLNHIFSAASNELKNSFSLINGK